MKIFEETLIDKMKLFLDHSARRQEVINSNLANIDTPGYRTRELNVDNVFGRQLEKSVSMLKNHPKHMVGQGGPSGQPIVREVQTGGLGNDLNNVDLDREMTNLAVNVLQFSTVAQLLQMKMRLLDFSIKGG